MSAGIGALAIVGLAFLLRVYRLGDKNIWWDEGWTIWLGQQDFAQIALRTAADEHPPLHYWLMNVWQTVFGADAFTGRFFSLFFGVLLVALVYRLGRDMGGARLGLLAALFLALARFTIWWSQDIKNYTLSAFFAWASVWFVWRIFFSESRFLRNLDSETMSWAGYILAASLALYSHYLAAMIVLANNVFVGIVLLARWRAGLPVRSLLIKWSAAQLAVLVLFAPWLVVYLQNGATWSAAPAFDFGLFLRLAATVLTLGVTTFIENYTLPVLALLAVAALSIGWVVKRKSEDGRRTTGNGKQRVFGTTYMLVVALLPPVLIYVLSLTPAAIFAPKIQARYLMMLAPAVALLLGLGILFVAENFRSRLARPAAAGLAGLVVCAQLLVLPSYYGERYLRDEYLTLAQMINNFGAGGDAIVLNTDQEWPTFLYYLNREFHRTGVPNGTAVDDATAQRAAADALQRRAVWVVTIPDALQHDPARLVEQKIAEQLPLQYEQTFGDKRLTLYADELRNVKDVPAANFSPQFSRRVPFDGRLNLVGVDLPVREALAGDVVRAVTYWEAHDLTTINLSLQTPDGEIVSRASIPISIGARERAQGDLQVPPDAPAEELQVIAHARLNALRLGTIHVLPRPDTGSHASDAVMEPRRERFGESIQLTGVNLPRKEFRAGETVPVTLFWEADAPLATSYTVFVHLLGEQYNPARNNFLWGQVDRLPLDGKLPTTAWVPGQTIADPYQIIIDRHAPLGRYKIEIGLYDAATGQRLAVYDENGSQSGDALIPGEFEIGE